MPDHLPATLYHYTGYTGLKGIIESKSIWCSQIQYMNDSQELNYGLKLLVDTFREHHPTFPARNFINGFAEDYSNLGVYVSSFCQEKDLLSQWRGYSDGGGVSIGFDTKKLLEAIQKYKNKDSVGTTFRLVKCEYEQVTQKAVTIAFANKYVDKWDKSPYEEYASLIVDNFIEIVARFKHPSFKAEEEWRLIKRASSYEPNLAVRSVGGSLLPYRVFDLRLSSYPLAGQSEPVSSFEDICITDVTVGPHPHQKLQKIAVRILGESHGAVIGHVHTSETPFRQM